MALIRCKECGGLVSDKAQSCPHCGAQINKNGTITRQNLSNIECRNKAIETEISGLLNYAHKAMDGWNIESAYEYYRLVLEKDEENWEAIFYTAFLLAYPSEESFKANVIAAINRCVSLFSTGTFAEQYVCNALNEIFGRLSWALSKNPFRIDMLYAYGDIINDMLPRYKDIICKVWLHAIKFDVRRVGWNTYCRKIEEFNDTKGIEKLNSIKAERERITQECADEDKRDKKLIVIGGIVLSALFVFIVWGSGYLMGFWGDYGNTDNTYMVESWEEGTWTTEGGEYETGDGIWKKFESPRTNPIIFIVNSSSKTVKADMSGIKFNSSYAVLPDKGGIIFTIPNTYTGNALIIRPDGHWYGKNLTTGQISDTQIKLSHKK